MSPDRTLRSVENIVSVAGGVFFGLSLIIAIGPQNVFVLRKGLNREHIGPIVAICAISDAILIAAGVSGIGAVLEAQPWLTEAVRIAGVVFLASYAAIALRRAARQQGRLLMSAATSPSLTASVSTCLAFTWLNPHVYLDTVVLLGAVANAPGRNAIWFAVGAMSSSLAWFAALGYGARYLRPIFVEPRATRLLDVAIAVVMIYIAASLFTKGVHA